MSLLLVLYFSFRTHAESLESKALRDLTAANSPIAAEKVQFDYAQRRTARTACLIQRRERLAPTACYEWLALERPADMNTQIQALDRLCKIAARNPHLPFRLNDYLSPTCTQALQDAGAVRSYLREDDPAWSEN